MLSYVLSFFVMQISVYQVFVFDGEKEIAGGRGIVPNVDNQFGLVFLLRNLVSTRRPDTGRTSAAAGAGRKKSSSRLWSASTSYSSSTTWKRNNPKSRLAIPFFLPELAKRISCFSPDKFAP